MFMFGVGFWFTVSAFSISFLGGHDINWTDWVAALVLGGGAVIADA